MFLDKAKPKALIRRSLLEYVLCLESVSLCFEFGKIHGSCALCQTEFTSDSLSLLPGDWSSDSISGIALSLYLVPSLWREGQKELTKDEHI